MATSLDKLYRDWGECTRCELSEKCTAPVLVTTSDGHKFVDVVFITEAPTRFDDFDGEFRVSEYFRAMLDRIPDIRWAITSVLACRPIDFKGQGRTRQPTQEEIKACRPRLKRTIRMLDPRGLVLWGALPKRVFEKTSLPSLKMRHPNYLARQDPDGVLVRQYGEQLRTFTDHLPLQRLSLYMQEGGAIFAPKNASPDRH